MKPIYIGERMSAIKLS